jgi:hypothetical protein
MVFVPFAGMEHAEAKPPGSFGAKASRLTAILNDATHRDLLTPTERIAFWTFLDTNAQFWGSYYGNRLERFKDRPGYRFDPDLATARGTPPFLMHPMPGAP